MGGEWLVGTTALSFLGHAAGDASRVLGRMWTFPMPPLATETCPTNLLLACPGETAFGDRAPAAAMGSVRSYREGMGSLSE